MSNFDDILKKGKGKATGPTGNKVERWKALVNTIVNSLNELHSVYDEPTRTCIQVDPIKCSQCNRRSFTLTAIDLEDHKKTWRYKLPTWKTIRSGSKKEDFLCGNCKGN